MGAFPSERNVIQCVFKGSDARSNWRLLRSLLHPTTEYLNRLGDILVYICSGGETIYLLQPILSNCSAWPRRLVSVCSHGTLMTWHIWAQGGCSADQSRTNFLTRMHCFCQAAADLCGAAWSRTSLLVDWWPLTQGGSKVRHQSSLCRNTTVNQTINRGRGLSSWCVICLTNFLSPGK